MLDPLRYDGHTDDPHEAAGMIRDSLSPGYILDVGCGTGGLSLIAGATIGIEPNPDRCAAARGRGIDAFETELTPEFIRQRGPFDAMIFADVLEHIPEPDKVLRLARTGLKPNGIVVASIPNVAHWSVRANLLLGRWNYEPVGIMDETHLRWFTRKTVRELFESCGFEVQSIKHTAGVDLPIYYRTPFRFVPRSILKPCIRLAARIWPTMFGCQHVVVAKPRSH